MRQPSWAQEVLAGPQVSITATWEEASLFPGSGQSLSAQVRAPAESQG